MSAQYCLHARSHACAQERHHSSMSLLPQEKKRSCNAARTELSGMTWVLLFITTGYAEQAMYSTSLHAEVTDEGTVHHTVTPR